ncbi:hypothetical protein [Methylobacterium nodulans]|uniref:Uncharacterized protein n=1 Tax=Methylobacterium nodulans (strain LMG 21967 / CNCM I-2342 / ORS 2060) TaxID=460265 RepID=B8IB42_METNO|nr:hypothetical protein [Methylobacterium nodulans]ACL55435.1 conserved hypothetical protein [Methylobacterium nodulans ORS 2060]
MRNQRTILALTAILCGAAPGAQAEDGVFMKKALSSIGLIEPERPTITYRERAPLVLPPKMDKAALPPPVPRSAVREVAPQWPTDPEAVARARRAEDDRKPRGMRGEQGRMSDNNTTLSIHEMRGGRREGAGIPKEPVYKPGDNVREATWLSPLELFKGRKDEDATPSDVEPSRDMLTDPPTGYRAPPGGRLVRSDSGPKGMPISDREEADPRAYLRSRQQ